MPLSNSMPFDLGVQRYELFYKISRKDASNQIILTVVRTETKERPGHMTGTLLKYTVANYMLLI